MLFKSAFFKAVLILFWGLGTACVPQAKTQTRTDVQSTETRPVVQAEAELRLLALGDSYTIGQSVPETERWPVFWAENLRQQGLKVAAPQIIAQTGWTTRNLQQAVAATELEPPYAAVSLMIGVNNQYQGRPLVEYEQEFEALLKQAIVLADKRPERVVVLSIPHWGLTPFAQGREAAKIGETLSAFNAANLRLSQKYGVHYVDVYPLSLRVADQPELLTTDGLHYSAIAHQAWALQVTEQLCPVLQCRDLKS